MNKAPKKKPVLWDSLYCQSDLLMSGFFNSEKHNIGIDRQYYQTGVFTINISPGIFHPSLSFSPLVTVYSSNSPQGHYLLIKCWQMAVWNITKPVEISINFTKNRNNNWVSFKASLMCVSMQSIQNLETISVFHEICNSKVGTRIILKSSPLLMLKS